MELRVLLELEESLLESENPIENPIGNPIDIPVGIELKSVNLQQNTLVAVLIGQKTHRQRV